MRKNDTALYKIKVCAVSVLLCGLFTVFAVGCSNQEGDDPENTTNTQNENNQSQNFDFPSITTISKITLPTNDSTDTRTGSFSGGRPTETKATLEGNKITMGEISFVPITKPEPAEEITSTVEAAVIETTGFIFDITRGTMSTGDIFDIVEDTTPTMVYGFNG